CLAAQERRPGTGPPSRYAAAHGLRGGTTTRDRPDHAPTARHLPGRYRPADQQRGGLRRPSFRPPCPGKERPRRPVGRRTLLRRVRPYLLLALHLGRERPGAAGKPGGAATRTPYHRYVQGGDPLGAALRTPRTRGQGQHRPTPMHHMIAGRINEKHTQEMRRPCNTRKPLGAPCCESVPWLP